MRLIFILFCSLFHIIPINLTGSETNYSGWPENLNTARNTAYLNKLEQQVILELNKVRSNPKQFAEDYLEELLTAYNGKLYTYPGQDPVNSHEGIGPLKECIQVLKNTDSRPILQPSVGLSKGANELVEDQQRNGGIGHISRNGLNPQKRIEKYGEWDICSAEDITYGSFEARQIVIALLIDDGVPDRGHRKNILDPCFHFAGVADGTHPHYQSMCVIDYAGKYQSK